MSKYEKLPVFKGWVYERFPFIQEDFDSLTSYELWCKVVEFLNKNLKVTNEIGENEELLSNEFKNLVDYVNNYFENLDVQDEINTKLDELVEDGTMSRIINEEIFTELSNRVSALETTVQNIEEVIDSKLENITPKIVESFYYYVSDSEGSDDNDGLTTDTPFKTLNKALSKFKEGVTDLRIQIIDSSEYYFDDNFNAVSDVVLHLNSNKSGNERPVVKFKRSDRSLAFYESHINLQNLILKQDNPNENSRIYFEGGSYGLTNIKFVDVDVFALQNGAVAIENLEVSRLQLRDVTGNISGLTIANTSQERVAVLITNCSGLRIYGDFNVTNLSGSNPTENSRLINVAYSDVSLMMNHVSTLSNKYKYGIYAVNSNIYITKNRFNAFNSGNNYATTKPYLVNVTKNDGNSINESSWYNLQILNGSAGTGNYVPKSIVRAGVLYLTGVVNDLNVGDVITTISGYTIEGRHTYILPSDVIGNNSEVRILENGNIILQKSYAQSGVQVFLDGIIVPVIYEN